MGRDPLRDTAACDDGDGAQPADRPPLDPVAPGRAERGGPSPRTVRRRRAIGLALTLWFVAIVFDVRAATFPAGFATALLPPVPRDAAWVAREPTLVVLVHGLARSSWSMARIGRALERHGYEVLNFGYRSTGGDLDRHAAALGAAVDARLAGRDPAAVRPRLALIGHSLGGLVIRTALTRGHVAAADAVCFLGTPQRGAVLADWHVRTVGFPLFLGGAAWQLATDAPILAELAPVRAARVGVLYGRRGDDAGYSARIPGDDDRRVGVTEASMPEATATKGLPVGHFELGHGTVVQREVLAFLATGSFTDA